ncbi:MAG: hypothetical protein LBL65_02885 [Campylobacteraceae bacterium]|jgi:hypothetical protein|nr:hypothetical protein [Campylobacteraceae bacterium]
MYSKKIFQALVAVLAIFVLAGCGGGGGGSSGKSGGFTSSDPIGDSTSGGDAADEVAYNTLKGYFNLLDDHDYPVIYRTWNREYFPVNLATRENFINKLTGNHFEDVNHDGSFYRNTT